IKAVTVDKNIFVYGISDKKVGGLGALRRGMFSWCRSTRISACNAARDWNSPTTAHQISLQRSPIAPSIARCAPARQPFWVCGRDTGEWPSLNDRTSRHDLEFGDSLFGHLKMHAVHRIAGETGAPVPAMFVEGGGHHEHPAMGLLDSLIDRL